MEQHGAHAINDFFGLLGVMLGVAVVVALILQRARQSVLIGYFICGVIIGPSVLGIAEDQGLIQGMAEAGVLLLLFNLGIEFSLKEILHLRRVVIRGGLMQMGLSTLLLGLVLWPVIEDVRLRWLVAAIVAFSSTALFLKIFQDSGQMNSPAGRLGLGIALAQDFAAIAFMILMPSLATAASPAKLAGGLGMAILKAAVFLVLAWVLGGYAIPRALKRVSETRSRELFTLLVLALCAGIAWLGSQFGLSLALGAFVAGLIVSETVYSHKILADILPFRDLFLTLFFISVGMLIDLGFVIENLFLLLTLTAAALFLKTITAGVAGLVTGFPTRASVAAAIGLSSLGEFSLVLLTALRGEAELPDRMYQLVLSWVALTMAATPLIMPFSRRIGGWIEQLPFMSRHKAPVVSGDLHDRITHLEDHAVICGYGIIGENMNEALRRLGVATLVIELNVKTVERLIEEKQPVLFADAAQSETLRLARLEHARVLAVTVPQYEAARAAVMVARELNPKVLIICRARFPAQVEPLRELGVQVVVDEELETSFAMVRRVLAGFERSEIEADEILRQLQFTHGVSG